MERATLPTLLLLPIFFIVESTRAALWAVRTIDEPDRDGPLLRALFALLVGALAVVPSPIWTLILYIGWLAWMPVRGILWAWGIGRESVKQQPPAVTSWYTRARRAKIRQRQRQSASDSE